MMVLRSMFGTSTHALMVDTRAVYEVLWVYLFSLGCGSAKTNICH